MAHVRGSSVRHVFFMEGVAGADAADAADPAESRVSEDPPPQDYAGCGTP